MMNVAELCRHLETTGWTVEEIKQGRLHWFRWKRNNVEKPHEEISTYPDREHAGYYTCEDNNWRVQCGDTALPQITILESAFLKDMTVDDLLKVIG